MLEKFNPDIQEILERKSQLISTLSTESKLCILATAEIGNIKALKQQIDYLGFNGDY